MNRKKEIKEAETYALSQLRALIGNALECDVEGSFEHEDGSNEWDAERIAEVRRLSEWARETTLKGADDVPTYCRWADATSPAAVLSLLDALEEARRDAEEARTLAETRREELRRMALRRF